MGPIKFEEENQDKIIASKIEKPSEVIVFDLNQNIINE